MEENAFKSSAQIYSERRMREDMTYENSRPSQEAPKEKRLSFASSFLEDHPTCIDAFFDFLDCSSYSSEEEISMIKEEMSLLAKELEENKVADLEKEEGRFDKILYASSYLRLVKRLFFVYLKKKDVKEALNVAKEGIRLAEDDPDYYRGYLAFSYMLNDEKEEFDKLTSSFPQDDLLSIETVSLYFALKEKKQEKKEVLDTLFQRNVFFGLMITDSFEVGEEDKEDYEETYASFSDLDDAREGSLEEACYTHNVLLSLVDGKDSSSLKRIASFFRSLPDEEERLQDHIPAREIVLLNSLVELEEKENLEPNLSELKDYLEKNGTPLEEDEIRTSLSSLCNIEAIRYLLGRYYLSFPGVVLAHISTLKR